MVLLWSPYRLEEMVVGVHIIRGYCIVTLSNGCDMGIIDLLSFYHYYHTTNYLHYVQTYIFCDEEI